MAHDIRGRSIVCSEGHHDLCGLRKCYCECHKPQDEQSVRFQLEELAKSTLPDSERLQVLIRLTTELAEGER